jgi:hypothetical protein
MIRYGFTIRLRARDSEPILDFGSREIPILQIFAS